MMQENMIHALKHFLKMLDLPLLAEHDNPTEFMAYALSAIKKALATGSKSNRSEGGYTPLMLYACFDIHDERLTIELANGKDYVTQTKDIIINESPTPKISAITFAIAFGSMNILERLYNLNYFSNDHLEEAAFFAVAMNSLAGIQFLRNKGVSLFRPMMFFRINPLHLACQAGFAEIVKEILATNPSDEQLSTRTFSGDDAYSLAVDGQHDECVKLFQAAKFGIWKQLVNAFKVKNLDALKSIIESNPNMSLWNGPYHDREISLLGLAAIIKAMGNEPICGEIYKYCETYINSQSAAIQINSLILALSNVGMMDEAADVIKIFNQLKERLLSLAPLYNSVDTLIVNGFNSSDDIIDTVSSIIKTSGIKKLDFAVYCPDVFDEDEGDACTINLWDKYATQIVAASLCNTTLTECPLYLTSSHKPIIDLLNIVLERNKLITSANQPTVREWIFNKYVGRINSLIEVIRKNPKIKHAELLEPLQNQYNVHSLRSLIAFNIANNKLINAACQNENNAQPKAGHTPRIMPVELQELIVTSKTPTIS
jgi:hypothetical protein